MGLAGPKNRFKLSHDPNNTTWSRNTSRFGHKILTAQGWTPGSHLGASNASHAAHHTAASLSHIRVLLKDDNLGLGAKRGSERAENFGMANFDDLLARLNGKSVEKVAEEKGKRRDAEMKVFHSQRWGRMVFVSGGFLVGNEIVRGKRWKILAGSGEVAEEVAAESGSEAKEPRMKRKRSEEEGLETIDEEDDERRLRKKKRKSNLRAELASESDKPTSKQDKKEKKDKKSKDTSESSKKSKKQKSTSATSSDSEEAPSKSTSKPSKASKEAEKAAHKAAKKARKEEKRARKEAKRAKRAKKASKASTASSSSSSASPPPTIAAEAAPAAAPTSTLANFTNSARHNARRRYIQAKRSAIMDPQALREIFMIKGQG